jgi:hypothetical protein
MRLGAGLLLLWGVGVWMVGGFNVYRGIAPPEKLIPAGIGGAVLVGLAFWLDRKAKARAKGPKAG